MNKIIAIYGPTTSNKLGLALSVSKYIWGKYQINSEIVNADSRKIYRGFIVSQSLPSESFLQKIKVHLFGAISPKEKLDLFDFQKLVKNKIIEIQQRSNLSILIGGSTLYLLSVLQNWEKGGKQAKQKLSSNILVFGVIINKQALKKAVNKNVSQMFRSGLYEEFKRLYVEKVSRDLLKETLGYRQFLEMAQVSKKSPLELQSKDLVKVRKWIVKDILNYAYHQTLGYKRFQDIRLIRDFSQARKILDLFLNKQGLPRE